MNDPATDLPDETTFPDDATLVAWIDGELPADEDARVAAAVDAVAALRRRADLLRAARREFAWALADDPAKAAPPAAPAAPRRAFRPAFVMLGAAALAVVVALATWRRAGTDTGLAAENDLFTVKLIPQQPAWPLFTGVRFELEGKARTQRACRIVARTDIETDAQALDRARRESGDALLLALDGEITGPDGVVHAGSIARVDGTFTGTASRLTVELVDLHTPQASPPPQVEVRLDADGPHEDFLWGPLHVSIPDDRPGFVPQEPGPYRLRLVLRSLGALRDGEPTFAPLELTTGFVVNGNTSPWSEPVDGLRGRIALGTQTPAPGAPLAFALQLRNDSDRERCFNVMGTTLAKIPQPFHFDLLVDGQPWTQRDDLGVTISWGSSFLPLPVDASRAAIALADYWRHDGKKPSDLRGKHQVALRFHFVPTLWNAADNRIWHGQLDTPPLEVDFGPAR